MTGAMVRGGCRLGHQGDSPGFTRGSDRTLWFSVEPGQGPGLPPCSLVDSSGTCTIIPT